MTQEEIKELAQQLNTTLVNCSKEVLTFEETARYTGLSRSYLYKLTMLQKIPYYKPMGKLVYFNRQEVEQWLQHNRINTVEEARSRAIKQVK